MLSTKRNRGQFVTINCDRERSYRKKECESPNAAAIKVQVVRCAIAISIVGAHCCTLSKARQISKQASKQASMHINVCSMANAMAIQSGL